MSFPNATSLLQAASVNKSSLIEYETMGTFTHADGTTERGRFVLDEKTGNWRASILKMYRAVLVVLDNGTVIKDVRGQGNL